MHSDGTLRGEIWINESINMKSNIVSQVIEKTRQHAQSKWPIYKPFESSRWAMNGNRIVQIQTKYKRKLIVLEWKVEGRKYVAHTIKKNGK